jgi:hypothetical protein
MWQSCVHAWLWCKIVISPPIPQLRIFARNFFNKIGAEALYLGYTSVKILLPLSCELWNQMCDLYSKLALYQLWGRGETPSGRHLIPEATSLWRVMIKHKNKADYSSTQWTISPLLFSHRMTAAHSLHIEHLHCRLRLQFKTNERSHFVSYVLYV